MLGFRYCFYTACFILVSITYMTKVSAETEKLVTKMSPVTTKTSVVAGESILGVVLSLILVVAIIFLFAWIMRRMSGSTFRSNSFLKVIGGVSMGARERIVLVQVGEEQLLLGVSPGRIQTLHKLHTPLEINKAGEITSLNFSDRLKSVIKKEK